MSLRIIAGELKGRRLRTAAGLKTRPTADRTREAVFNILGPAVRGTWVLDLFAGTGAFGIEAVSRGAVAVVFVEIDRKALQVLNGNLHACGLAAQGEVIRWDAARDLNCLKGRERKFQLVFMDPPYGRELVLPALSNLDAARCLDDGARLVVEHGAGDLPADPVAPYQLQDQRRYGKTLVSFLRYVI
jgi:16S rRNA (guanine966-N2)-methyltransferase